MPKWSTTTIVDAVGIFIASGIPPGADAGKKLKEYYKKTKLTHQINKVYRYIDLVDGVDDGMKPSKDILDQCMKLSIGQLIEAIINHVVGEY